MRPNTSVSLPSRSASARRIPRLALVSLVAAGLAPAGALRACPPAAATCPCDWDGNGVLDCADLAAYMNDYFLGDPCADYNGVGGFGGQPTVQDMFDFLDAINHPPAGCPAAPYPFVSPQAGSIVNHDCANASAFTIPAGGGPVGFNLADCNNITDGPAEPNAFGAFNPQVHNDIWYTYTPGASGTLTIDTDIPAGAPAFATRLAVYIGCPGGSGTLISYGDTIGGSGAKCAINVTSGQVYTIRVGGRTAADGVNGQLRLTLLGSSALCPPAAGGSSTSNYSITGAGNGGLWSWSVQTPSAAVSGVENVGVVGTNAQVAARFVSDINTASIAAGCTATQLSATDLGSGTFSITVPGSVAPTLWVGPNPGTPTCLVHAPLAIVTPPCSFNPTISRLSCPGDFNNSGAKSPQDIFDFLAAYFSHAPSGDFNHIGGFTVQDIFDFLAAYFTPCS